MNYFKQVYTVTKWEFNRFYKLKNELIGIVVLLIFFAIGYFGGNFAVKGATEKQDIILPESADSQLSEILSQTYNLEKIPFNRIDSMKEHIQTQKEGMLLWEEEEGFRLFAYKQPGRISNLQEHLNDYRKQKNLQSKELSIDDFELIISPAPLETQYVYEAGRGQRRVVAFFFAGLMVMAVFQSFAYQFTAITGEKQLKITEQIISAIKPQVWMDGKILGITLTGISSMVTYLVLSILGGMLLFLFTGASIARILDYVYLPALLLYFLYTLMGILMWNSLLAAIASIITDPNNSGKSSLMMLPALFVLASLIVLSQPDNHVGIFLSWFPLTSATGMPMRWIATELAWWELVGSFLLLTATVYLMRKLAATIFRVSILISGKEPSWSEVYKMMREK